MRPLRRFYAGINQSQRVKPLLMLEDEIRKVHVDSKSWSGLKNLTLSAVVWESEGGIEVSGAAVSGDVATANFTAERPGLWWVKAVLTFNNGEKYRMEWRVQVMPAFAEGDPDTDIEVTDSCPVLYGPLDGEVIPGDGTVALDFGTDPAGANVYYIYLWEEGDPAPGSPTATTLVSPYVFTGLDPETTYNWYVTALYPAGETEGCEVGARSFTTSVPIPACPVLVTPADGAVFDTGDITFTWLASSGAISYNLYVNINGGGTTLLANTAGLSYNASLPIGAEVFWTVAAVNASGESSGCGGRSLTTTNYVLLSAASYTAIDTNGFAEVVILRNGTIGAVTADFQTQDDTAVAPTDYTATSGTAEWPNGDAESRPVQIPIEPLASITQRATDYLPDWGQDSDDPRVDERPYDYRYGSTTYATEGEAVEAAETALGYELAKLPIWRRRRNGEAPGEPSPLESVDPGEDEFLNFQYVDALSASYLNTSLMYSGAEYAAAVAETSPPDNDYDPFTGLYNLGIPMNTYFYVNIGNGMIGYLNSDGDPRPNPAPTVGERGWVAGNNCIVAGFECPFDPSSGITQLLIRGMTDIGVRRLTAAPPLPGSEFPDWPVDPDNFWQDPETLQIYSKQPWSQVMGSYRWLSKYSVSGGGFSVVQRKPLGPVLLQSDPAGDEAFWTAAYDAAVLAGELPSGMTYDATGTASDLTRYPKNATYAYERSYKLPLSFTVVLSNPVGAALVEPDEATVYILPA